MMLFIYTYFEFIQDEVRTVQRFSTTNDTRNNLYKHSTLYAWEEAVTVYITSVITIVTLVLVVPYMQTKSNRTVYI